MAGYTMWMWQIMSTELKMNQLTPNEVKKHINSIQKVS